MLRVIRPDLVAYNSSEGLSDGIYSIGVSKYVIHPIFNGGQSFAYPVVMSVVGSKSDLRCVPQSSMDVLKCSRCTSSAILSLVI